MNSTAARQKLDEVISVLAKAPIYNYGLMSGSLGLCYFYYCASIVLHKEDLRDKGENLLYEIFDGLNSGSEKMLGPIYSNGLAGFAFVLNDLVANGQIEFDLINEFSEADEMLLDWASDQIQKDNIDFLHGAMGVWHYFASRRDPVAQAHLNSLAEVLFQKAKTSEYGTWFINLGLDRLSESDIDFGIAHGQSGYLLMLLEAYEQLRQKDIAKRLIYSGMKFLKSHEFPVLSPDDFPRYPLGYKINDIGLTKVKRLAWCYGDLNETLLYHRAATLFNDDEYRVLADRIGHNTLFRKSFESTLSEDAHFCHGHAGLTRIYKTLFEETGKQDYLNAYHYWLQKTIEGVDVDIINNKYAGNPVALLEGWTGIAFVLLDSLSEKKLSWPRVFLL
jgi:lantibiotic modifying enzyme